MDIYIYIFKKKTQNTEGQEVTKRHCEVFKMCLLG